MKTWIKRTLAGLLGATVLFGGFAAYSGGMHHRHGAWQSMSDEDAAAFKAKMVARVTDKLELDAAQQGKLGALFDEMRAQRKAFMGDITDPRAEVRSLVAGNTFDRSKAQSLVDAKTAAVQSGAPQVIAALGDFYDSLNETQQAQVRDFMASRHGHGFRHGDRDRGDF